MIVQFAQILSYEIEYVVNDMTDCGAIVESTSYTQDSGWLVVFAIVDNPEEFMDLFSKSTYYTRIESWQ